MNWAYQQKAGNSCAKAVLVALSNQADQDGRCWPSIDYLMERTELSRRAVVKHLAYLEAERFIDREVRPGDGEGRKTNVYILRIGRPRQPRLEGVDPPIKQSAPDAQRPQSARRAQRGQCAPDAQRAMCTSVRQCAPGAPKQSINNQLTEPIGSEAAPPNFWDVGKKALGIEGSVIGKWIRDHGEGRVAELIAHLSLKRPADPVQYGTAWLQERPRKLFVPNDDEQLVGWAKEHGFPGPTETETYQQYRSRLWQLARERQAA